jgi:formylglycine-generating enzyme required for sulfatase activity
MCLYKENALGVILILSIIIPFSALAEEEPAPGTIETVMLSGDIALEMVWIPSGKFMMGRAPGEFESLDSEDPQREVIITGFWIGKYEVTQEQWQAVMGNNPAYFKGEKRPVERVSWNKAQEFIEKLNEITRKKFRLPSEAEWEYACRAGTTTRFYWGDDHDYSEIDEYAWYSGNSDSQTHEAGQKRPNAWGLYDMSGNVWEWCEDDWHTSYHGAPTTGEPWIDSPRSHLRILRGGSWRNNNYCRSATRADTNQSFPSGRVGFRLAR